MTHCNDQLIDQLLTQAEQGSACLIPPERGDPKSAPSAHNAVVSPIPGCCAKNALG